MGYYRIIIALAFFLFGCNTNNQFDMNEFHKMYGRDTNDIGTLIEKVAKQNIYFGHQSVGWNILSGIEKWEEKYGVKLSMIESRDFSNAKEATFYHFAVGKNSNPKSKIDDFISLVETIPDTSEAVVFFKLCYVDIVATSDVKKLFEYYKHKMHNLNQEHPENKLVLMTVPLTGIQKGWKSMVKKILGKVPYGYLENIKRNEFNSLLKEEFSGVLPIFDLAGIESTLPDGSIETFSYERTAYPCVPDFYTSDMGHLNEYGAKVVSYNLLAFLAEEVN